MTTITHLKTLAVANAERERRPVQINVPNGILCPNCENAELTDDHPASVHLGSFGAMAQLAVTCSGCGWKGYRVA